MNPSMYLIKKLIITIQKLNIRTLLALLKMIILKKLKTISMMEKKKQKKMLIIMTILPIIRFQILKSKKNW